MNLKNLKNLIENKNKEVLNLLFISYNILEVMVMNSKRLEILRLYPTEFLLEMLDNIEDLSEQGQKEALEEITYILYEREVKENEE